ncbi:MAG: gfo/Idh/MocA family oxidoreductase, partial [Planctomycetales bacterium]|nr:gfo/Idh/MocA family oxidoreductase [Planctomycetales bacterium]
MEGIEKLRAGELGRLHYARTWYNNRRTSIGRGKQVAPPAWLNYELWQGPAPTRPYKDNLLHYNWHWHWHWGNGELGNNGVHALDVARWGMGVDFPIRVSSGAARFRYEDDQETPDTQLVTYEFPKCIISWEGLSWSPLGFDQTMFGVSFHGEEGSMVIDGNGYRSYDMRN